MRLIVLFLAACSSVGDYPTISRTVPVLVRLEAVAPQTLAEAAETWEPLGPRFEVGEPAQVHVVRVDHLEGATGTYFAWPPKVELVADDPVTLAHELGHALGLQHVTDCGLMTATICAATLTTADVAEYGRTAP